MTDIDRLVVTGGFGQIGRSMDFGIHTDRTEIDVTNQASVLDGLRQLNASAVLNLASIDLRPSQADPAIALQVNVDGTYNVARAARELGIPVILITTGAVFNGAFGETFDETATPDPLCVYAKTKHMAVAANPEIETAISYTGSWTDVSAAREATLAQIAQGADVLIHNANEGARGFFQAVRESKGVRAFGANKNQNQLGPEHVLASATLDVPQALVSVARDVREGRFVARALRFGLADSVIAIEWNQALWEQLPDEVRAASDDLIARIKSGELVVPRGEF